MKRFNIFTIICVLLIGIFALCACEPSSEPKPFPPPEGYSSWDEYYEEYYREKPPTNTPSPPPSQTMPPPSSSEPEPEPELSASFEITDCEQIYYEFHDTWGNYVDVYYEITNTGDVDIGSYELYFTVLCEDGKEYEESDHGVILHIEEIHSNSLLIDVNGREANSVEISDWELTCFGLGTIYKTDQDPTPSKSCSSKSSPLNAKVEVKDWEQDYNDYFEEWSDLVEIYFEIENIGDLEIDYYEIFYIVECSGGNDYYGMVNGLNLKVGRKDTVWTIEMVNGNKVLDIEIDDLDLEHY